MLAPGSNQQITASAIGYYNMNSSYNLVVSSITAFITNVMLNMTAYSPVAL
jgi:hypothetical protein